MNVGAHDALAIGPSTIINICGYLAAECRAITNKGGENVQIHALLLEKVPVHIRNLILYEYEMYAELQCPHMLRVISAELVSEYSLFLIETRMCYGITLSNLMHIYQQASVSIPEEFIWFLLVNIAEMLVELHDFTTQSGVERRCHFLTPSNIFISVSGEVQIFPATESLSSMMHYDQQSYLAPELLSSSNMRVTPQSDIWSLGKMLSDMCLLLFPNSPEPSMPVDVCIAPTDHYTCPDGRVVCSTGWFNSSEFGCTCYSLLLTIIIGKCMSPNPQDRPSAEELLSLIPHGSFSVTNPTLELMFNQSHLHVS